MSVVPFVRPTPPDIVAPKDTVWECTVCGSQRWFVVLGGELHCAGVDCKAVTTLRWFDPLDKV